MKNNPWLDLHLVAASKALNKPIEEVTKEERDFAKVINFSKIYSKDPKKFFDELHTYLREMADCRSDAFEAYQELKGMGLL